MAAQTASDICLWIAKYAFQGVINNLALVTENDLIDATTFGATYHQRIMGLRAFGVEANGFWDSTIDLGEFSSILGTDCAISVAQNSTIGAIAYCGMADGADYKLGSKIGDAFAFTAGAQGVGKLGRGQLVTNSVLTSTVNSLVQPQLGALSASQSMICNIHVPTVTGSSPTLDIIVQSAAASDFSGATTRATFTQITAAGSAQKIVTGPVTDTWWRYGYTLGGSSPNFTVAGTLGIAL